ncbi:MAG: lamin tail domain-containing protein, partial [Planctomycetota bacterium]
MSISMRVSLLTFVLTISLVSSVRADFPVGDLNGDCDVNLPDLKIFIEQWLDPPGCLAHPNDCANLDAVNGVDMADLALLAVNWLIKTGSLQVTILPPEAVAAGAQWHVDGGTWRDSDYTETCVTVGTHTVEYKPITGWNEPNSQTVQINNGQTTTTSGTYILQTGSLQVTILPPEAVATGAQWRVDGGIWQNSGYTKSGLPVGSHTVEYKPITDWNEPNSHTVQIDEDQTTTTTGTYIQQTGSLEVTILPPGADAAGAQWCVDGGTWRSSGYTESGLSVGSHTVEYKPVIGWNRPANETVQISDGQMTSTSGTYILQTGSLRVTISPQEAIDAGAQWRVDGGTWQDSNYTESGLLVGFYAVEFSMIDGWSPPATQMVQINDNQTTTTSGIYIQQIHEQLKINEFMASNASAEPLEEGELLDGNDESSDWIEIYNPTDVTVDLDGWYLTDSKNKRTKWQFPGGLQIYPGEFLIIFASEKTYEENPLNYPYLDPGGYYHTNFELDKDAGEYLALVAPDGNTVVHEYSPKFPSQLTNISYGLAQYEVMLVPAGATATYHVPTGGDAALGTDWTSPDFNDSAWDTGGTGLGFGSAIIETGQDIGTPSAAGFYSVDNGVYTVEGDGEDIWGPTDDFYYVYTPLTGDGEIIARVISIERTNSGAKAGVMIREDLTDTSSHAMMIATPPNGADEYAFQWVDGTDRDNNLQGGDVTLPSWLKIERIGDNFTGYYAPDIGGSPGEWVQMGTTTINMIENVYIGLCVTSRSDGELCTAVFDNVTRTGGVSTDLREEMLGINASLWTRIEFYLDEDQRDLFDTFILRMKYEDGLVAYLNGQEVASCNAPNSVEWNSTADSNRPIEDSLVFEEINIMPFLDTLRIGRNVLAIHGLNDDPADDKFLILPELFAASSIDVPQYFATATPDALNVADAKGIVSEVWFSHERGYYDTGFQLILSTAMEEAEIHYTVDGSYPTITNGLTYTYPIDVNQTTTVRAVTVKPGWLSTDPVAHTYIFLFDVANQPKFPPGFPTNWGSYTADYEVDPDVVNTTLPGYSFEESLLWIPSISITMLTDDLFGAADGIYVYSTSKGDQWERPASIELIYPDGRDGFQINAGVHMHGGASRNHSSTLKHSFRLVFRGIYGPTKLHFPLFSDSDVDEFNQLVLRGSSGDSWTYPDSYRDGVIRHIKIQAQYTRDPWMKDTQRAMGHNSVNSIFVHLYLNGLYWGQYNLCERPNSSFQASYLGGDRDDYDAMHDYEELQSGTFDVWDQMFDMAAAGLANDEDAQLIQGNNPDGTRNPDYPIILNVDNLIDYMILHHFARSEDWPCHNFWAGRRRGPLSEGFMFFVWDQENHNNTLERFVTGCGCHIEVLPGEIKRSLRPGFLYAKLRDNPMFRRKFSDQVHKHMFNDGLLTIEKVEERWMKRATEVDKSVVAESARWGDAKRSNPYKREVEFLTEQNRLHTEYWPYISAIVLDRYRGVGLYPDIHAPVFRINDVNQHGGQISNSDQLTMDNPDGSGTIYYTTDGNDPRLPVSTQIDGTILVAEDAPKKVLVPTGSVNDNWQGGGPFNDSSWNDGTFISGKTGGVGYDERADYKPYISYDVESLMNADLTSGANTSCYIRILFTLNGDPCDFNLMNLKIRYDDGFVAYLNGDELKRINFPDGQTPQWNSNASGGHEASGFETIPVSEDINSLQQGDNILAIHGMNNSNTSSDFLISVELVASDVNSTTGGVSPSAIEYSGHITLNKSTHVKACVLDDTMWSALNEAIFAIGPVADNLCITEIMYHPKYTGNLNDPNEEFIELKNIGPDTLNLNLVRFTEGIDFTFPDIELELNECVVVVKDQSAFEAQYGTSVNVAGEYTGSLANNGERIRLMDAVGQTILDFEYEDGWRRITDGDGFSLTIIDPTKSDPNSWDERESWRASVYRNGSPGWDDSGILPNPGAVVINEVMSHSNAGPDWIELYNTTDEAIDIGGWFLSDNDRDEPNRMKYRIGDGTTIDPNSYLVFYEDTDFNKPVDPCCLIPFALSENGEEACLSSPLDPNDMLTGYREVEDFGASQSNVSLGRYYKSSTGNFNFVAMDYNTPDTNNA